MKLHVIFWFLLLIFPSAFGAVIKGKIRQYDGKSVVYYDVPVAGRYFDDTKRTVKPDKLGNFTITINASGFVYISYGYLQQIQLYVSKESNCEVSFHQNDIFSSLVFNGNYEQLNAVLNAYPRDPVPFLTSGTRQTKEILNRNSPETAYQFWHNNRDARLRKLDSLFAKQPISEPVQELLRKDLRYYFVNQFTMALMSKRQDKEWQKYYQQVMNSEPVNDSTVFASKTYQEFVFNYCFYYKNQFLHEMQPVSVNTPHDSFQHSFLITTAQIGRKYLQPSVQQMLEASLLQRNAVAGTANYTPLLVEFYQQFKQKYPDSVYLPYLEQDVAPAVAFVNNQKPQSTQETQFIDGYENINTLKQLVEGFRDKIVYVDLWATWCEPCIQEFAYKDTLQALIQHKPIEVLYLSRDKLSHKDRWRQAIKHYGLEGYHAIASDSLAKDIWMHVYNSPSGELPHYLIVNSNGDVLDKNAPKPSQPGLLLTRLTEILPQRRTVANTPEPFENEQLIIQLRKTTENDVVTISGSIQDKNKYQPVWGMNITLVGHRIGTVSIKKGDFTLKVPTASGKLRFELANYKPVELEF